MQYKQMLDGQGGVCAICGEPPVEGKNLSIDHDHSCCPGRTTCGKCIRGLLCNGCNLGIGYLKDDIERLRKAMAYLVKG
jgi:hypothetical protein